MKLEEDLYTGLCAASLLFVVSFIALVALKATVHVAFSWSEVLMLPFGLICCLIAGLAFVLLSALALGLMISVLKDLVR